MRTKTTIRKRLSAVMAAVLAFTAMFASFPIPAAKAFTDGENASDVLGQTDGVFSSLGTNFTKAIEDDGQNGANGFRMSDPYGVAFDGVHHRFFIADNQYARIFVYDLNTDNTFPDTFPDHILGAPTFTSLPSGPVSASRFSAPYGLAYDSAGDRLFVADTFSHRILVFDTATIVNGEDAVNVLGQTDMTTTSSHTISQSTLGNPTSVLYDGSGLLYVADSSFARIMVFDVTSITDGEAAVNELGQVNFTTSSYVTTASGFQNPQQMAYDATGHRLFVADAYNYRVMVFDVTSISDGESAVNVLGQANFTTGTYHLTQSGMGNPFGLSYDASGNRLFVTDNDNNRVMVFDVASITDGENAVNVLGQADFTHSGQDSGPNTLYYPAESAYGSDGRLYVADENNARVMVFDVASITDGEDAVDLIGPSMFSYDVGDPSLPNVGFYDPRATALDATHHRFFVADSTNNRVVVYDLNTDDTFPDRLQDKVLGHPSFRYSAQGTGQAGLHDPEGVAYDSVHDRLFVADSTNNRVLVFDVASITNGENAANVLGQTDFSGIASATTQNGLSGPVGVTYDADHDQLFVTDRGNNRVMIFDVASITDGENAVDVLGQSDFTSGSPTVSPDAVGFSSPRATALDGSHHRLFVADTSHSRVMEFNLDANNALPDKTADHVIGQADFNAGASATDAATMSSPQGVTYDATNDRLLVSDTGHNRMLAFDVASITDGEDAVGVLGQATFTANSAATTQSGLSSPVAVTYDSGNATIFVSDLSNQRVMAFDGSVPAPTNDPTLSNKLTMSRLKAGTASTVALSFQLQNTLTGTLTVTFPGSFTVTGAFTSGSCSGGGTIGTFNFTSTTLTAVKTGCAGTVSLSGATVTTPNTPGLYTISWTNDDPGYTQVAIMDDDQVTVSAQVDASITFDIDVQSSCGSESAAPYTVPLGNLSSASVTTAASHICLDLDANAAGGAVVTLKGSGASDALESAASGDVIATAYSGTPTLLAAGTEGYGICVVSTSVALGSATASAPYNADCSADYVGGVDASAAETVLTTGGAAVQGTANDTADIVVRAAIASTTAAANDYTDTLTFIATGTF